MNHLRLSNNYPPLTDHSPINDYASQQQEENSPTALHSRFRKMEDPLPFTKKVRSYKKHYANNLHDLSHLKYLGSKEDNPKLQSSHDNLNIKDISGATPDYFHNEIFKNRMYGKRIDRQHIFNNHPTPFGKDQRSANNGCLPKLYTEEISPQNVRAEERDPVQQHSMKLNIQHEVLAMHYPAERERPLVPERRRIKTELDNPENYFREYRNSPSKQLRKWNPTYLTDASNPLLPFLPKIK